MCIQLTCLSSQRAYVEFYLRNYYDYSFHEHTSLGSSKGAHYLNPKRYYGAFIENTYCYHLPSTITQSIGYIWSTYHLIVILLKIIMRYQMFRFVTCYLLCLVFPWTDIHSLTKWKLLVFQDYLYHPWVINPPIVYSIDMSYLSKSLCRFLLKELLWP